MLLEKIPYDGDFPMNITICHIEQDPIHYHVDIEFVYVLKGSVRLKNGCCVYQLREGDIFTNSGHEVHGIFTEGTEENVVALIQISNRFFSQFFPNLSKSCYRTYSKKNDDKKYERLKELLLQFLTKYISREINYKNECIYLMVDVLKHLNQYFNLFVFDRDLPTSFEHGNPVEVERVSRICQYIYQRYADNLTLADISEMEHLSTFYISHMIKDFTGMCFRNFLCFARVEWSEIELLDSNAKISQIARDVGFSTTAYYEKYFCRWFHNDPQEHREKYGPLIKSDLNPALFTSLSPGDASKIIKRTYATYNFVIKNEAIITHLNLDAVVHTKAKPLCSFNKSLSIRITAEDHTALGFHLLDVLHELHPTRVVLYHTATENPGTVRQLIKLLKAANFSVCDGGYISATLLPRASYDSIAYAIYLLHRYGISDEDTMELWLRDQTTERFVEGQPGLITGNGIRKSAYYIVQFLTNIKGQLLQRGRQFSTILGQDGALYLILCNSNRKIQNMCCQELSADQVKTILDDFKDELTMQIEIDLPSGFYSVIRQDLTARNNVFFYATALDGHKEVIEEYLYPELFSAHPQIDVYTEDVRTVCSMNASLRGARIHCITIKPQKKVLR